MRCVSGCIELIGRQRGRDWGSFRQARGVLEAHPGKGHGKFLEKSPPERWRAAELREVLRAARRPLLTIEKEKEKKKKKRKKKEKNKRGVITKGTRKGPRTAPSRPCLYMEVLDFLS